MVGFARIRQTPKREVEVALYNINMVVDKNSRDAMPGWKVY